MFLWVLSWFNAFVLVCIATFCMAVSLYFVAELVEENTKTSGKIIRFMIGLVSIFYVLLGPTEGFPLVLIGSGLFAQLCYFMMMRNFPVIEIKSVWFFSAIGLIVWNHYLAFQHFASHYYQFGETIAFFVLCMWIVPMSLLVSLSANDFVLPTYSESNISLGRTGERDYLLPSQLTNRRKGYNLKAFLNYCKEEYLPKLGLKPKKAF